MPSFDEIIDALHRDELVDLAEDLGVKVSNRRRMRDLITALKDIPQRELLMALPKPVLMDVCWAFYIDYTSADKAELVDRLFDPNPPLLSKENRLKQPGGVDNYLGEWIRSNRKRLKLTQARLASLTGASPVRVSNWERGYLPPSDSFLKRLHWVFSKSIIPLPEDITSDDDDFLDDFEDGNHARGPHGRRYPKRKPFGPGTRARFMHLNNDPNSPALPERAPEEGELVQVRSRQWLVEEVRPGETRADIRVRLSCTDDDALGQALEVFWECEIDRKILDHERWRDLARHGFDRPELFAAFLHTLRWNCVTATDPNLFQAPFRAGIQIDAFQMEPLRKALSMPRVRLFLADDTGLGKTIEAGLIARELLLREKAQTIVVAAPPSVLEQWKAELEERFGLIFEILDRAYLARMRHERGFGVNPWRTHSRFLISHNLLIDPTYTDPMREWLGAFLPGSLLILDEAHHAAPAAGTRYGIETKFTRAVRDMSGRFEHRLFLSATPHNGHSNSFSTLLELLDPYRFTRGVPVHGNKALKEVMVRRVKEDIREVQGGFPQRRVERVVIDNLPDTAPELVLSRLLDEYRTLKEKRLSTSSTKAQAAAGILVVGLQQRLLSSIEAFARTLKVHRETVRRQWERTQAEPAPSDPMHTIQAWQAFLHPADADDERADWSNEDLECEEHAAAQAITVEAEAGHDPRNSALWQQENELLDRMEAIAEGARHQPDAKTLRLIDWIREQMCPDLPPFGQAAHGPPAQWNQRRVLIFTENRQGTKRYLSEILRQAIAGTDRPEARIEVIDGLTSGTRRKEIQRRFNSDPSKDPLRILLATDAAREGLNFQAHCADLFHFDLPWNPGRIEQRNGRIDRKLQPAPEVRCYYFILPQRAEDRVLQVLVTKTETIRRELGSLSKVIDEQIETRLEHGIRHSDVPQLALDIEQADLDPDRKRTAEAELEAARERQDQLKQQIERCRNLLETSRKFVGFDAAAFRNALSCALGLLHADGLTESRDADGNRVWTFPRLDRRAETDASWAATLDTLRTPRKPNQKLADWRREAPIRPVVFEDAGILTEDTVHLHLEQRVAQRLLARFRAQGFVNHDLSRACLLQSADSIPRVILLGRIIIYGRHAERLHEEIIPISARWVDPAQRIGFLKAYARDAEAKTMELLDQALTGDNRRMPDKVIQQKLLDSAFNDVVGLLPQLEERALEYFGFAFRKLIKRGEQEAENLRANLERQRERVQQKLDQFRRPDGDYFEQLDLLDNSYSSDEKRQLEADLRAWRLRMEQFEHDLQVEPLRIREFYRIFARHVDAVGLIYLWPETN